MTPNYHEIGCQSVLERNRWNDGVAHMPAQSCLFLCLKDNFGVLVHDPETMATAAIDAPEAPRVAAALGRTGWSLTDIWLTHPHLTKTGATGNLKPPIRSPV